MLGTWVQPLVWKDFTCHRATKPVCHNHWRLPALEPECCNYWSLSAYSPCSATEAHAPLAPAQHNRESPRTTSKTQSSQKQLINKKKKKDDGTVAFPSRGSGFCCSVAQSCLTQQRHGLQQARPPRPLPSPRVCPSLCPLHWWCHPAISSPVTLFSFCLQSSPASGSFPVKKLFASGDQSIGASASASALPMSIQAWFPLRLTGLISLLSKRLSRVFSSTTVRKCQFFGTLPSLWSSSHNCTWLLERAKPWLCGLLLAKWCLCFLTHCLGLLLLSCREAII